MDEGELGGSDSEGEHESCYLGDEISLRPGETAKAEGGSSRALTGTLQVMSNNVAW